MQNSCSLVIDGYNVLFQTPLMVAEKGTYNYDLSRKRLIAFVESTSARNLLQQTVVVFDSKQQRTLEAAVHVQPSGLNVVFASNYAEADAYIEDLIARHPKPRSLTVVSSDGKIKSTARSYAAPSVGAREWYEQRLADIPGGQRSWIMGGTLPEKLVGIANEVRWSMPTKSLDPDVKLRAKRDLSEDDLDGFDEIDIAE